MLFSVVALDQPTRPASNNTAIGSSTNVGTNLTFATANRIRRVCLDEQHGRAWSGCGYCKVPGIINSATQYNLGGNRILGNTGSNNIFIGVSAGDSITTGAGNSFFGTACGQRKHIQAASTRFRYQRGLHKLNWREQFIFWPECRH
jgi:hypothetical protein